MNSNIFSYAQVFIQILMLLILLGSATSCLISYAVVPNKYENEQYSKKEVERIAFYERSAGINFAYSENMDSLKYSYLPLLILLIANILFGFLQQKSLNGALSNRLAKNIDS